MSNATRTPQQAMADAIKSGAVQAFADGKPVQVENYGTSDWKTFDHDQPQFYSPKWGWRPSPTPRLRPWKPEEVPVGALIRRLGQTATRAVIIGLDECDGKLDNGVLWPGRHRNMIVEGMENCLRRNEHSLDGGKTWHPCGVQEGGE